MTSFLLAGGLNVFLSPKDASVSVEIQAAAQVDRLDAPQLQSDQLEASRGRRAGRDRGPADADASKHGAAFERSVTPRDLLLQR